MPSIVTSPELLQNQIVTQPDQAIQITLHMFTYSCLRCPKWHQDSILAPSRLPINSISWNKVKPRIGVMNVCRSLLCRSFECQSRPLVLTSAQRQESKWKDYVIEGIRSLPACWVFTLKCFCSLVSVLRDLGYACGSKSFFFF